MKKTNDLDFVDLYLAIKNNMAASVHFPVAAADVAAISSFMGISGQLLKATIKHGEVGVALFSSPAFFCLIFLAPVHVTANFH